jgi:hypothetical protein
MELRWWHLPGPSRFVQSLAQDLRSGKNLVVVLPRFAPEGFRDALADRVRENELWRWRAISARDFPWDQVPCLTEALHRRFLPTQQAAEQHTPLSLAQRLVGTIVWVEDAVGPPWLTWARFLSQYQHACQSCPLSDRSLFCLPMVGNGLLAPHPDAALSVRRAEGTAGSLDMALYLHRTAASRFSHPLHQKIASAVITELAGSDARLAQWLVREDLADILDPMEVLCEVATERGWTQQTTQNAAWHDGACDLVDGRLLVHSAVLAMAGDRAEVARRVWRGQVAVLYPFIEEQRCKVIPQVRGYLRFPLETTYGRVDRAEDLEVGQLLYFLRGKNIRPSLWRLLGLLTEMRHALAHLEPVPLRCLCAEEVLGEYLE